MMRQTVPMSTADLSPYQAVVVVSFGGPESPEEVRPFLRSVTAGRAIPEARLDEVCRPERYVERLAPTFERLAQLR